MNANVKLMGCLKFSLLILLISIEVKAQTTYPIVLPSYNIGSTTTYTVQATVLGNNVYEYAIRKVSDPQKDTTFILRPNNIQAFKTNVEEKFKALLAGDTDSVFLIDKFDDEKDSLLDLLYYQFVASEIAIDTYDDRPVAGKLFFRQKIEVYPLLSVNQQNSLDHFISFKLDSAQLHSKESGKAKTTRLAASVFEKALDKAVVSYSESAKFGVTHGNVTLANLSREEAAKALMMSLTMPYHVDEVELEFNEGFIENIKVIVHNEANKVLKFENSYPIGFSSKRDIELLYRMTLYAVDGFGKYSIFLGGLIDRYEQKHEVNRRDYSPANEAISFDFKRNPEGALTLHKETTATLFELKTFSDFVGLDQSSPNGLIQIEIEKRLNLVTHRKKFPWSRRIGLGFFQYLTPFLLKSKFEENNKYLTLNAKDRFLNNQYYPLKFTSTLELKRFENLSVGSDLNIFLIDFPSSKFTAYVNAGLRYGRVAVRDSLRIYEDGAVRNSGFVKEFGVNTFQVMLGKILLEFKTDERYSVDFAWSLNMYFARDNNFHQIANIPSFSASDGVAADRKNIFHNIALGTSFRPSSSGSGRLFFRYRYNWQQGYWNTGFHQAQVGFSVYLTKALKPPTR